MLLAARYVLPITSPFIEDGAVLVRDDKIIDVGPRAELVARYPDEPIEDFGLSAIMPGFIDLHTHLEYTVFRGLIEDAPYSQWKYEVMKRERLLSEKDWEDSAYLGALEAVSSGITTIADITTSGASCRAAQDLGLRGTIYREVETMEKSRVDAVMDEAVADIAAWQEATDSSRIAIGIAPHSAYSCHPSLFARVAEYAMDGTPVAMHLAGSIEEYQFVKYGSSMLGFEVRDQYDVKAPLWLPTGVSPVRYILQWGIFAVPNVLAVHCTQVDDEDIAVLASYDVAVAHCPRCNSKLGMGIAPLPKLIAAGLRVGIGTDSPAASNATDMFEEMRIGLLVQRAAYGKDRFFTAERFLRLATIDGARALGMQDSIGSLEPGKLADIIAVDLSQSAQVPTHQPESALVHSSYRGNVSFTMVGGNTVFSRGPQNASDHAHIKQRAQEIRDKLRDS